MAVDSSGSVSRRELLKGGAALGASVLWAAPVVQVIGMSPAFAIAPSPTCAHRYRVKWDKPDDVDLGDVGIGNLVVGSWTTGTFFCLTAGGETPADPTALGLPIALTVIAGTGDAVGTFGVELDLSGTPCTFDPADGGQAKCASPTPCSGVQPCEDADWNPATQKLAFGPCYCLDNNGDTKYHDVSHIEVILCCN